MNSKTRDFLTDLGDIVSLKHTALVVIDVQNDFCHPGGAIAKIGSLI
ncbi:MAG: hypothetical protein Q8P44_01810 [Dehalococcoidia bacterium]|nr:hypothetical protein [Dehalococcoidia bacterium]